MHSPIGLLPTSNVSTGMWLQSILAEPVYLVASLEKCIKCARPCCIFLMDFAEFFYYSIPMWSKNVFNCKKKIPCLFTWWKFTAIASSLCRFIPPVLKIIAFVTVGQKLTAYTLLESLACVHTAVAADYSGKNELCLCIYVVVVFSFILKLSRAI